MRGFREQLLKIIENQIITKLVIPDPEIDFQNDIPGYGNLYNLKFTGSKQDGQIILNTANPIVTGVSDDDNTKGQLLGCRWKSVIGPTVTSKYSFLAPRQPRTGYSTPLRYLCTVVQLRISM